MLICRIAEFAESERNVGSPRERQSLLMNDPSESAKNVINEKQKRLARVAELEIGKWINHTRNRVSD